MRWLHRLLNDCDELLTQLAQVHFIAQRYAKSFERTRRIILAPEEAAVDECLDAPPQGIEQCSNCKSGGHNGDVRGLTDESAQQELQRDDESNIEQDQCGCQRAVDQRAVDDEIDIPES